MQKIVSYITNFFKSLSIMNFTEIFEEIDTSKLLWNKKPILYHSILVWDLENIPFKRLPEIKRAAAYSPEKLYVITKQNLSEKNKLKIQKEGFKIFDLHNGISDEKIINIMKIYSMYANMILVSSDSDFVNAAKIYLKNNKLQWIINDKNKKRILMKMDITNKNLKITTI